MAARTGLVATTEIDASQQMKGTLKPLPNILGKGQVRSNNKILPTNYVDIGVRMLPLWRLVQEECKCEKDSDVATILVQGYFEKTWRMLEAVESYIQLREKSQLGEVDGRSCHPIKIEYQDHEDDMKSKSPTRSNPIHPCTSTDIGNHSVTTVHSYEKDVTVKTEAFSEAIEALSADNEPETLGEEDQSEALNEEDLPMGDTNEDTDYDSDILIESDDLEWKDDENDTDFRLPGVDDSYSGTTKLKGKRKRKVSSNDSSDSDMAPKKKKEKKVKSEPKPKAEKKPPKEKVVKTWLKIKLDDHKDKFTIERVESFERRNRGVDVFDDMYSCLVCRNFKTVSKDLFEEHIEQHVNKALECDNCDFVTSFMKDLWTHRLTCGERKPNGKLYFCHLCGVKLYSKTEKKDHMGKAHNVLETPCRFCKKLLATSWLLTRHYQSEHAEEINYCRICKCGMSHISKQEYLKHIQECVPGHQCQECGKMFLRKYNLSVHFNNMHLKIKKYSCKICPYTATCPAKLKNHVNVHNGIHPHQCDLCTFTCVQRYQLKSHMRTHTGEKPYKCDQCNYAAAWNVQLKDHKKVHTSETAVICQQCNVVFKNTASLIVHQNKQHSKD